MSTQPDTPTDPPASAAEFPLVLRGYDRHLVDSCMAELVEQLDKERERSDQAEQALQQLRLDIKAGRQLPEWFASLGAEVRQVGEQAGIAAETLLGEVGKRAQTTVDAAEVEAADRRKAAEEQANNLEETARETLAEAQTERARIQAEATAAAERLVAEAGKRAQTAIEAAEAQAADRLKAAEEQARNLEETARETLAAAQTERARIQAEATTAADEARARADRDATAMLAKAQEEATLAWQKAARERVLLEAENKRLTTLRQRMVEQLGQVYAPLGLTLVDTRRELEPSKQSAGGEIQTGRVEAPATATDAKHEDDQPARPDDEDTRNGDANWWTPS